MRVVISKETNIEDWFKMEGFVLNMSIYQDGIRGYIEFDEGYVPVCYA